MGAGIGAALGPKYEAPTGTNCPEKELSQVPGNPAVMCCEKGPGEEEIEAGPRESWLGRTRMNWDGQDGEDERGRWTGSLGCERYLHC